MSLTDKHKKLLLSYQIKNTENIMNILQSNRTILDASDTGTGKTYSAVCACSALKLRPIIICPKAVMSIWKKVCDIFNVVPFFIVNYETLKNLKYYDKNNNRIKCPYIKYEQINKTKDITMQKRSKKKIAKQYKWSNIPKNVVFIFDEVHKCSNLRSYNGLLLRGVKDSTTNGIIMLSATLADKPEKFKIFFYMLNFIEEEQVKKSNIDYKQYIEIASNWISKLKMPMLGIHNMLYPNKATRMNIDDLGDLFPETQITATPYSMGKTTQIQIEEEYEKINKELELLKIKAVKDKKNIFVRILRAHQKIELLKIPTFIELTNNFLHDNFSVVIFVNFSKTLKVLQELLLTNCTIHGDQTDEERQRNINAFQSNSEHVIICNIKAGGVGISLHDIHGARKRVSLISPCWSSLDLTQALGRIHRAGSKSKSLQRIIYTANTIEEKLADKLQKKLQDLNSINNGDLALSNISFLQNDSQSELSV
jgi:hypothetical protein